MYTFIIVCLCILSIMLILFNRKLFWNLPFFVSLFVCCLVGWTEFVCFLRYDAWVFSPSHVLGIEILGVTIEDFLFCPCFAVIFWKLYFMTKKKFNQRVYNPTDKLIYLIGVSWIALIYFDLSSIFGRYMSLRTCLGIIGLIYCWNKISFRHSIFFMVIVYCIGFFWDLPSVANKIWVYTEAKEIYTGINLNILGATFPIELFGYYFTGGHFTFWIFSAILCYFQDQLGKKLYKENFKI